LSNLIYACWRDPADALDASVLLRVAAHISPFGPGTHPPRATVAGNSALCLTGPSKCAISLGTSAHLGALIGPWPDWHLPESELPDGTFALVRSGDSVTELCSDFAGSRTLWYVDTGRRFLASTSQRALACLLGSFEINASAKAWFLSSGNLGPADGWDLRLSRLPGGARLRLDRVAWQTRLQVPSIEFKPRTMTAKDSRGEMMGILRKAIQGLDLSVGTWAFPLSGGFDCRFILTALLDQGFRPLTMTWGLAASLSQPGNDAFVAQKLAEHYALPHEYLLTDISEASPEQVVDAFLAASGGTTDQLFPYLDGLRLWSGFSNRGIDGVIRGDEGFGWIQVISEAHARASVGMALLSDFMDEATAEQIAGNRQQVPEHLRRREDESIPTYRDRLYHSYRIPVGLAALNDVKAPFVEIASPLISRSVLSYVREMPDALRTDKALFKSVARSVSPDIPYATMGADDDRNGYLKSDTYTRWFLEELATPEAERLFPASFRTPLMGEVLQGSWSLAPSWSMRAALKRVIPSSWVRLVRARMGLKGPEPRHLALRSCLICRMIRMLERDSRLLAGDG